jgi:tRNA-2-methylthio-N6-dimethylallyladenosine synthase
MAKNGVKEITLLGQNVNAYKGKFDDSADYTVSFSDLIKKISDIGGIERIFYTSSHPSDVTLEMIKTHSTVEKLMPFWHLPIQSGSDKVLNEMNRTYTVAEYKEIINTARKHTSHIAMSSDFIVGFPNETEADFQATLDLVREIKYSQAFSFKYSPRPGTVAAKRKDQISEHIKTERLERLQALLREQQTEFNKGCIGKTLSVMFQKSGKREGQILGKSEYMQSVIVDLNSGKNNSQPSQNDLMYSIQRVRITKASLSSLSGELIL